MGGYYMRFGSCKLNETIVNNIVASKIITSKEIDVILWLARRQDDFGRTFNVKYFEVCNDIGISHQEFYNCIKSLSTQKYIKLLSRSNKTGWDIELINNIFHDENDDKKRYLNINRNALFSDDFISLKANEKKLILKIIFEKKENKKFFLYHQTISKWLGIFNKQLIKSYINNIKDFFFFLIEPKQKSAKKKIKSPHIIVDSIKNTLAFSDDSIINHFYRHKLKSLCRNLKIPIDNLKIDSVITIIKQFKSYYDISSIHNIIFNSIEEQKDIVPQTINWLITHKLQPN